MSIALTATILVTDRCNLACKYCYEEDKQFETTKKEYIDKFIEMLYSDEYYSSFEQVILEFIGGEALLEYELVGYAMSKFMEVGREYNHHWIKEGNHVFSTCTNGTLFKNKEIKEFCETHPCLNIGLSLDGSKHTHDLNRVYLDGRGSYDDIMENFEWWKNRYKQKMVKGTFGVNNLHNVCEILTTQVKLGMTAIWCNPVYEHEWTEEEGEVYYKELCKTIDWIFENHLEYKVNMMALRRKPDGVIVRENKDNYCGTCKYMVALGLDGNIYSCHRFCVAKHKFPIGNVDDGISPTAKAEFIEGTKTINKQIGSTFYPVCYAQNFDVDGKWEYHNSTRNMTEAECRAWDYWKEKSKEKTL